MNYAYYPGCSLTGTAIEYDVSTRALMTALGTELKEIPDWTCCGATAAQAVSETLSHVLPARNLALAERDLAGMDIMAPCSACYLNLKRTREEARSDRALEGRIESVLAVDGLAWEGFAEVRHLLDVLSVDVGRKTLASAVKRPLEGLTIAPYYGCQAIRPYAVFDDPERPTSMEPLLKATGATVHEWDMGGVCCGASLATTHKDAAVRCVANILTAARGADAIVTVCPLCQMNLESFQKEAGLSAPMAVLYLPQLLGLALGLPDDTLMLSKNLALPRTFFAALSACDQHVAMREAASTEEAVAGGR